MKQTKFKNRLLVTSLIVFVLLGGVFSFVKVGTTAYAREDGTAVIADHVSIGGVDVSGMTKEEADEAVEALVKDFDSRKITLTAGKKEVEMTPADAGFTVENADVTEAAVLYGNTGNLLQRYRDKKDIEAGKKKDFELVYTADEKKIESFLNSHKEDLETQAVNHGLTRENGVFNFKEGTDGLTINVEEVAAELKDYFEKDFATADEDKVALKTEVTEPVGSAEDLKAIQDVLGSFSTNVGSFSSGRGANVINGASKINGTVVYPGETLSVGTQMGPSTRENGYVEAGAYENGKVVQSLGGGICQVSTTLYNAVIRAEMEVVERYEHSMIVGYVKPSEDAAIADGVKDFKFKNTLDYPVYLEMYGAGGVLYANVYGKETRPANRTVTFESETLSTIQPTTVLRGDSSLPIGTVSRVGDAPHTGYTARLWKVVTVGGVEQSREIFNTSKYRATNVTYAVGTRSDSPEAVSAISAAISTNSLDKVRAAAAQWNAAAVEQKKAEAEAETAQAAEQEQQNTQPAAETPVEQPTPTPEPVPVTETPQDDPGQPVAETPAQ